MTAAPDRSHLNALEMQEHAEEMRLRSATATQEKRLRAVWLNQGRREIADERARLGLEPAQCAPIGKEEMTSLLAGDADELRAAVLPPIVDLETLLAELEL